MVSSRAGLALAAAFTIAATLLITAGVSAYMDLQPSLWGAEVFPYLALILGLENILCITKAVVYTPPSLDVASRIAHGLSHEGYTLTKYFILELIFLSAGFVTGVAEIQQFCQFAFAGLVADFFMQIFFYVPCLALDLHRLSADEKKRFSLLLLTCKVPQLTTFPSVNCPVKRLWPSLFERARKRRIKRTLSDSRLDENLIEASEGVEKKKTHRRSASSLKGAFDDNGKPVQGAVTARRLRIMYFISRTRFFQRTLMITFAIWVIWLGFIVRRNLPISGSNHTEASRFGVSQRLLETAPQEWGEWQRRTFKWWPVLFAEYNLTLSGHYITYLPPIVLKTTILPDDPLLFPMMRSGQNASTEARKEITKEAPNELRSRIEWLELQLRVYMTVCVACVLTIVILFLLYACFWGQWRNGFKVHQLSISDVHQQGRGKNFGESVPLKLAGHRFPVESVLPCGPNHKLMASVCQDGKVVLWDETTGLKRLLLNRNRANPANQEGNGNQESQNESEIADPQPKSDQRAEKSKSKSPTQSENQLPTVWCAHANDRVIVLGCSDGSVEVGSLERAKLLGVYLESPVGVVHIKIKDNFLVMARLDGTVETLRIDYTQTDSLRIRSIRQLSISPGHQKPITVLEMTSNCFVTASHDHTVKIWEMMTGRLSFTLHAHNAPLSCLIIDEKDNMLYSSCEEGVVCWWRLSTGELVRNTEDPYGYAVELALTKEYLLGLGADRQLSVWSKENGQLITRLAMEMNLTECPLLERRFIVALSNQIAVTAQGSMVSFWDLSYKALIREVDLECWIDGLSTSLDRSVFVISSNNIFKITVPIVRLNH